MAITRQISRNALILQNTDAEVAVSKTLTPYYEWVFNGQLNFPVETPLDTLHHLDAENTLHQVRITARKAGDSTYTIKLISYDVDGLNPITHVDDNITFSGDRETYLIPIINALVESDRIIEARLFESVVGVTPAEDVTLTVTLGSFEELMPITNGHLIQRDDNTILPKREKLKFAGDVFTVSDDLPEDRTVVTIEQQPLADLLSPLLDKQTLINFVHPIGGYVTADLTEAQLQAQFGAGFVLADGRSVVGSAYEAITGKTNIPDRRGTVGRMKDNGRGLDPAGDPALGSYQDDRFQGHHHNQRVSSHDSLAISGGPVPGIYAAGATVPDDFILSPKTDGVNGTPRTGPETRAKATIENVFIRIN
jgi:hypothetical protein